MRYSVYYNNNVECNKVAEFDTLDEAKAYCAENTKDYDEISSIYIKTTTKQPSCIMAVMTSTKEKQN